MLIPTIIMAVLAIGLTILTYTRVGSEYIQGMKSAGTLLLQIAPLLIFSFIIAGMIPLLIPTELISKWVGAESGFRGILLGTLMGCLTPSGPFVSMPIAAGLLRAGAGIGTMVAFITSWSVLALNRLPMEFGIIGWKFSLIRLACTFFFPIVAGFLANAFFSNVDIS
jgi:uncharacterized membrane protein YraQ (UPF0718 family)